MRCGRTRNTSRRPATSSAISTAFLLSPDGAFYVSQDADLDHDTDGHTYYALADGDRRKLGMPRIDKHLYARENGWAITGLAAYYDITNDPKMLAMAERAATWVIDNRALPGGGFRHGERIVAVRSSAIRWRWGRPSLISMPRPATATG